MSIASFKMINPKQRISIEFKGSNEIIFDGQITFILPTRYDNSLKESFIEALFQESPIYVCECGKNDSNSEVFYSGVIKGFAFYFSYYNESGIRGDRRMYKITSIYASNSSDEKSREKINQIRSNTQKNYYLSLKCSKFLILESAIDPYSDIQEDEMDSKKHLQEAAVHNIDIPEDKNLNWDMFVYEYRAIRDAFDRYNESLQTTSSHIPPKVVDVLNQINYYAQVEKETCEKKHYESYNPIFYSNCRLKKENNSGGHLFEFDLIGDIEPSRILKSSTLVDIKSKNDEKTAVSGRIVSMDQEKAIISCIKLNAEEIEEKGISSGVIFEKYNSSQDKKRFSTINSIISGNTPSIYMNKLFSEWDTDGYIKEETIESGEYASIVNFLLEKCSAKYPPNQMQMEAIIKGIFTKDVLLVQGPPGTGKTTVIKSWVEYFSSQGKRVLIASQNNSAVDNVLSGLKSSPNILRLGHNPDNVQEDCRKYMISERKRDNLEKLKQNTLQIAGLITAFSQVGEELEKLKEHHVLNIGQLLKASEFLNKADKNLVVFDRFQRFTSSELAPFRSLAYKAPQYLNRFLDKKSEELKREIDSNFCNFLKIFMSLNDKEEEILSIKSSVVDKMMAYFNEFLIEGNVEIIPDIFSKDISTGLYYLNDLANSGNNYLGQIYQNLSGKSVEDKIKVYRELRSKTIAEAEIISRYYCIAKLSEIYQNLLASFNEIVKMLSLWSKIYMNIANQNNIFNEIIIANSTIVGATCMGTDIGLFGDSGFDVAIIDEAGQIQAHNVIVPMASAPKILMLGDHKQIPPIANKDAIATIERETANSERLVKFDISFFETMFEEMESRVVNSQDDTVENRREILSKPALMNIPDSGTWTEYLANADEQAVSEIIDIVLEDSKKTVRLNTQFRMPGIISEVVSQWFYENNYYSGYNESQFNPIIQIFRGVDCNVPFIVISTSNCSERHDFHFNESGYKNDFEAEVVTKLLKEVYKSGNLVNLFASSEIGIISPYGKQKELIRSRLKNEFEGILSISDIDSAVNSLDSFQGQERDLIIYDFVRSSKSVPPEGKRIGFLSEIRRLNVAFTRPKKQLVLIGDMEYLLGCDFKGDEDAECNNAYIDCEYIDKKVIKNCNRCKRRTVCEKQFSLFMQLVVSHVKENEGCVYIEL